MKKVLVIDDEKPTLAMFRLFLSAYGYSVLTAENGVDGLATFTRERPPIVITDIKMPGMDGFEVLKRIKELDAATEVIVITGHGDMDLAIQALNLNATDFINKPIQKVALEAALARAEERLRSLDSRGVELRHRSEGNVAVIALQGNLTSRSEPILMEHYTKVCEEGKSKLLFHFDANTSVNGAGLAVLIQILTEGKRRGQTIMVSGLSENFKKIFEMVGITRLARSFDNEQDALTALAGS